ncbi:MAG: hypothetical protein ACJAS4_000774 [Bacteriovoracaceae bacterium]|jgi:hypothetical protein
MSKKLKFFLSFLTLLLVFVGTTLFFISTKINPILIKEKIIETVQKSLPGSRLEIQELDYSISSAVKLSLKNIKLSEEKSKNQLLNLSDVSIKIPILAIISSGGTIDIQATNPTVFLNKNKKKNNWENILPKIDGETKNLSRKHKTKLEIPKFLNKSKINITVKKLLLKVNIDKKIKSEIKVSKVKIKNIKLKGSTAFEISSAINLNLDEKKELNSMVKVIGTIKLMKFFEKGHIESSLAIEVSKTSISSVPHKIPNIRGTLKLSGELKKIKIENNFSLENLASWKSDILLEDRNILISEIGAVFTPGNLKGYLDENLLDKIKALSFGTSKLVLNGRMLLKQKPLRIIPDLDFKSSQSIQMDLADFGTISTDFNGTLKDNEFNFSTNSTVFGGNILTSVKTKMDLNNSIIGISTLKPIDMTVTLSDFKVNKYKVQDVLYNNSNNAVESEVTQDTNVAIPIELPHINLNVTGNRIMVANENLSFSADLHLKKNFVKSDNLIFRFGRGKSRITLNSTILSTDEFKASFTTLLKNFDVTSFNAFFPPYIKDIKGKFNGKLSGELSSTGKLINYKGKINITGKNGELKNLNLARAIGPMLGEIQILKGKIPDTYNYSDVFDSLSTKISFSNKEIKIRKFKLVGNKKTSEVISRGTISMVDNKSWISGQLYVKEFGLQKLTGKKYLLYLLSGVGFGLKPDLKYLTDQNLKSIYEGQVSKRKKKIQSQISKGKKEFGNKLKNENKKN